jgi:hypothetical protein
MIYGFFSFRFMPITIKNTEGVTLRKVYPFSIFRSCLSYYFLIEIELFLIELDFNLGNIFSYTFKKFKYKSVQNQRYIRNNNNSNSL